MVLRRMQVCAASEELKQWLPTEVAVCEFPAGQEVSGRNPDM